VWSPAISGKSYLSDAASISRTLSMILLTKSLFSSSAMTSLQQVGMLVDVAQPWLVALRMTYDSSKLVKLVPTQSAGRVPSKSDGQILCGR
jgi:hypothetical protein